MNILSNKLKALILCAAVLLIGGGSALWAQHKTPPPEKEEMVPVRVGVIDQAGSGVVVLSYFVDRKFGATPGGDQCCVMLPKQWRPGLTFEFDWDYTDQSEGSPPPQKKWVEVEEYKPERMGRLYFHIFPGHRVRAISSNRGFSGPFYPLPREEWGEWTPDIYVFMNWKNHYYEMVQGSAFVPDDEDWKWAAQWGLHKEEAMHRDTPPKQEPTP